MDSSLTEKLCSVLRIKSNLLFLVFSAITKSDLVLYAVKYAKIQTTTYLLQRITFVRSRAYATAAIHSGFNPSRIKLNIVMIGIQS